MTLHQDPPEAGPEGALARRSIECLRSGVPSRRVASRFVMGREALLERLTEPLRQAADGGAQRLAVVLQAGYGDGKTHVLHALWQRAAQMGYAVSLVAISRETGLHRMDTLYARLAEGLLPGEATQPGLERLVAELRPGTPGVERLLSWTEASLHPKVFAVLRNRLEEAVNESEQINLLDRDLTGTFISMPDLRAIHRLNFRETLRLPQPFRPTQHAFDYLRLADAIVHGAGRPGWLILLDELELIARLGRGQRATAYACLGRLLRADMDLPHTHVVGMLASNFSVDVLQQRRDATGAVPWLQVRGRAREAEDAAAGMAALQDAALLPSLDRRGWLEIAAGILQAHQQAYRWSADGVRLPDGRALDAAGLWDLMGRYLPDGDVRVRTRVRLAIQLLDFLMQYGHAPSLAIDALAEARYEEEPAAGAAAVEDA